MTVPGDPSDRVNLPEIRSDPSISWPPILFALVMLGFIVWQFSSILKKEEDFPSDRVDMAIRGDEVVVYNPTNEIVNVFEISVLRLSGTYSYTDRNLRPTSSRRVSLKKLRKQNGQSYDPAEDGECRIRLEYWLGEDREEISRYCRGF